MNVETPSKTGQLQLQGRSMFPTIRSGQTLNVNFYDQPQYLQDQEVGSIVLARENGLWVAHRVISYKNKKYFKGDWTESFSFSDQPFIWGKVININGDATFCDRKDIARLSAMDFIIPFNNLKRLKKITLYAYIRFSSLIRRSLWN